MTYPFQRLTEKRSIALLRFIDTIDIEQFTLIISFDPSTNPMKVAFILLLMQMRILKLIVVSLGHSSELPGSKTYNLKQ